jgi:hypothetical protein
MTDIIHHTKRKQHPKIVCNYFKIFLDGETTNEAEVIQSAPYFRLLSQFRYKFGLISETDVAKFVHSPKMMKKSLPWEL